MTNARDVLRFGTFGLAILIFTGGCFAAARPQQPQSADSKDSNAADDHPRKKGQAR